MDGRRGTSRGDARGGCDLDVLVAPGCQLGPAQLPFLQCMGIRPRPARLGFGTRAVADALSGIAVGLKYTNATFLVGIGTALWFNASPRRAIKDVFTFGIAAAAGILLAAGEWMWTLYTHFGSPLFPYFNSILHSPWWDANSIVDPRFGP